MCGIVYAHDFTGAPVNNGILQQFDKQRSRGTEGFGVFDGLHLVRAAKEEKIMKWLVKYDSDLLLFHHRNPTSTINVKRAAHPFSTKDYFGDNQYVMVHNGMITNEFEMKEKHEKMGITYQSTLQDGTFNDSEALAWELALTLEGKQEAIEAKGGIAFVCIKLVKGKLDKLYFGRNSSPLNMYRDKKGIALSSEGPGESIDSQKLYTWNYKLKRLTNKAFEIPSYYTTRETTPTTRYYDYYDDDNDWRENRGRWGQPQLPYSSVSNVADTYIERQYGNTGYTVNADGLLEFEDDYFEEDLFEGSFDLSDSEMRRIDATISVSNVEGKIFDYLCANSGVFSKAYYAAEEDYQEELDGDGSPENYRDVVLIERVMDTFCEDPEFRTEESVSSVWRAIWKG